MLFAKVSALLRTKWSRKDVPSARVKQVLVYDKAYAHCTFFSQNVETIDCKTKKH